MKVNIFTRTTNCLSHIYIYIYIYIWTCVWVWVRERERERVCVCVCKICDWCSIRNSYYQRFWNCNIFKSTSSSTRSLRFSLLITWLGFFRNIRDCCSTLGCFLLVVLFFYLKQKKAWNCFIWKEFHYIYSHEKAFNIFGGNLYPSVRTISVPMKVSVMATHSLQPLKLHILQMVRYRLDVLFFINVRTGFEKCPLFPKDIGLRIPFRSVKYFRMLLIRT